MIQQGPANLPPAFRCLLQQRGKLGECAGIVPTGRDVLLDEHVQVAFSHIGVLSPEPTSLRAASLRRIAFSKFNKDLVSKTFAPRLYHQIAIREGQSIHRAISNANATPLRTANFFAPIVKNLPSVAISLFVSLFFHRTHEKRWPQNNPKEKHTTIAKLET